jgi:hypothetical protein
MENPDAYMWLSCWVERSLRGRRVNALLLRMQRHQEDIEGGAPPDVMTVSHWESSSPGDAWQSLDAPGADGGREGRPV